MKGFIVKVLFVSLFFIGLGGLVEKVGLFFKPPEKTVSEIRIIKLKTADQTIIRRVQLKNSDDCRFKIGPVLPSQSEMIWSEKAEQ
jgi:hypothetical protein